MQTLVHSYPDVTLYIALALMVLPVLIIGLLPAPQIKLLRSV